MYVPAFRSERLLSSREIFCWLLLRAQWRTHLSGLPVCTTATHRGLGVRRNRVGVLHASTSQNARQSKQNFFLHVQDTLLFVLEVWQPNKTFVFYSRLMRKLIFADSSESGSNKGRDSGSCRSGGGNNKVSSDGKPTRVRTVLNEKQLHTLRTCYAANPRPDALMKEQLVEMTGLSPRVIRVWFQNKRCKDKKRAILMKQQLQQEKVNERLTRGTYTYGPYTEFCALLRVWKRLYSVWLSLAVYNIALILTYLSLTEPVGSRLPPSLLLQPHERDVTEPVGHVSLMCSFVSHVPVNNNFYLCYFFFPGW